MNKFSLRFKNFPEYYYNVYKDFSNITYNERLKLYCEYDKDKNEEYVIEFYKEGLKSKNLLIEIINDKTKNLALLNLKNESTSDPQFIKALCQEILNDNEIYMVEKL
jgi:hypothetical protein